jgi:coenzyme F420 biosynthesis associated uncharacterized protein
VVDWGLARRTAEAFIVGLPGRGNDAPGRTYAPAEVEAACLDAIATVSEYAGLGTPVDPPPPELVGRRAWARNALGSLADAAAPLEERLAEDLSLPGPLGGALRRGVGAAIGVEAGMAAGYAAKRVLGQYDVAIVGAPRPARLLLIAENMAAARDNLDADHTTFLRWVALHECAHVVQFECVPWLPAHVRSLAAGLLDGAADGMAGGGVSAVARRALRDPAETVRALARGELARLLADPQRRALLDRLQATMSVIEGHAEHVMDACFGDDREALDNLRRGLEERRARRGGLGELIARLLGMDLKLRQYELGKRFCDRVVEEAGAQALHQAFAAPEDLPSLDELERPGAWLERVAALV